MTNYRLAWCSDLHFDFIRPHQRQRFLDSAVMTGADGVLITGDISMSRRIGESLGAIAGMGLPTYFVTGNHDYYAGDFATTDATIASVCHQFPCLTRLGLGEIIPLGERTVLIGHSGWGDGRAGIGPTTPVRMNDSLLIADLRLEGPALFDKLAELGTTSAQYIERVASIAVHQADLIVVATHVPPFPEASRHEGKPGEPSHLPHFCNVAMGESLRKIARTWPHKRFLVLCGHTHERFGCQPEDNLIVKVAGARYGQPAVEEVLEF
jgi:Icc-related predicted phosphoesterase